MILTAQIIGIFAMAAIILSFQFKNKRAVLACQLIGSALFAVNMYMLGAFVGAILNTVGIVRALVYMQKEKIKIPIAIINSLFLISFVAAYVLVFTVFDKSPTLFNLAIEFLPIIGMSAVTIGFSKTDSKSIRIFALINSPCWLIYNCFNFTIGGILCEVISLVSIISAMIRIDSKKRKA